MSKRPIPAHEFAEVLLSEFIDGPAFDPPAPHPLNESETARFHGKARLYKLAITLHHLRMEEKDAVSFAKVRTILEFMVFPSSEVESVPLVTAINSAMKDIGNLISPSQTGHIFAWAHEWLGEIAIDETNPVTLAKLAMHWTQVVSTMAELIAKHDPQ